MKTNPLLYHLSILSSWKRDTLARFERARARARTFGSIEPSKQSVRNFSNPQNI